MRRRGLLSSLGLALGVLSALAPQSASARRQPAPGGQVSVALPPELVERTLEAHTMAPLVEPIYAGDAASLLAHPPLAGAPQWRSQVLSDVAREDEGRLWRLVPRAKSARALARSVRRCLLPDAKGELHAWPAAVLRAASLVPVVRIVDNVDNVVQVAFERPVGPFPELLSGCFLIADDGSPTGPYAEVAPAVLAARPGLQGGLPLLGLIELRALARPADLVAESPQSPSAGTLEAPFPDVVLLLQAEAMRKADPLRVADEAGLSTFRAELSAELLLAVYWSGRGRPAEGILPPRLAPARPLSRLPSAELSAPLALVPLSASAPRVRVRVPAADGLLYAVLERLAVLLRTRGYGLEHEVIDGRPLADGAEIVRWRPPTTDPAIALLALAGERPVLRDEAFAEFLRDPRLLSADPEERLEAALSLERAWMESRVIVPLMTAQRWFAIDPALRGVKIRPDGVPLLDDAYWGDRR